MSVLKGAYYRMKTLSKAKNYSIAINVVAMLITIFVCQLMLEISTGSNLFEFQFERFLFNYVTIGVLWSIIFILCNCVWMAGITCTVLCGFVAIINYYVIKLHGMPLSFLLIKNIKTAMNVVSIGSFTIDIKIVLLVAIILLVVFMWAIIRHFFILTSGNKWKRLVLRNVAILTLCCVFVYWGYFNDNFVKPVKTITWSWPDAYHQYGYAACTVESVLQSFDVINCPVGYSEDKVKSIKIENEVKDKNEIYPDIILILNESFYDLNQITEIETDVPYFENISQIKNLRIGNVIVPSVGGGTNSSEYELLTSNSLYLMPGITPFNVLNLNGANSIVSHLNALGYSSLAAHPETAINYSRGQGYSNMGFHIAYFDTAFENLKTYYDRWQKTDESLYSNLTQWYESDLESNPKFMYLLTIQNHSEWNLNKDDYDIVHTMRDYGEYTDVINEYLTCIYNSDQAFKNLTDYFLEVEHPVLICMVGDHAPYFAESIIDPEFEADKSLLLRKVPLLVWANYELGEEELGTMSMNFVVPTVLDIAGVELTPYYNYMLQLKKEVPIITSYGDYYDVNGNQYKYSESKKQNFKEVIDDYFFLEYNNLQNSNRVEELFLPYK